MLGNITKDYFSSDVENRKNAKRFLDDLASKAVIPLLCWHHFEELIKHRDDAIAKMRFNFIKSLPQVAWIPSSDANALGSIVDLLVAECRIALQGNGLSALEVRDRAKSSLICFGAGYEAIAPYEELWQFLRPYLWVREEKAREIVAIRRAKVNDISKQSISNFLSGKIRDEQEAIEILHWARLTMAQEIGSFGDRRIPNANEVASRFYDDLLESDDVYHLKNGGLQQYINYLDMDTKEFGPNATMGDFLELIEFQQQLKVVHRHFAVPWDRFKERIQPEQLPSWIIKSTLHLHSQEQNEYKGSELNDHYLACLSPYVDFIYVDKRMKNDILRASRQNAVFDKLLSDVSVNRVRPYKETVVDIMS
jgi:hypothetical protein